MLTVEERDHERCHDLLPRLFEVHKKKPNEMNDNAVLYMATSNVFAGTDITAISLRLFIYSLLKILLCKERFIFERISGKREESFQNPSSWKKPARCRICRRACMKPLKLHPAVGMSLPLVVPADNTEISEKVLPAGATAGVNPWVAHRDREVFGEEVETFRKSMLGQEY